MNYYDPDEFDQDNFFEQELPQMSLDDYTDPNTKNQE